MADDKDRFAFSQLDQVRIARFLPLFADCASNGIILFCFQRLDFLRILGAASPSKWLLGRRDC